MRKPALRLALSCLAGLFLVQPLLPRSGIKLGMSVSFLNASLKHHELYLGSDIAVLNSDKDPYISCLQIGVFNTFKISDRLEFQPELCYSSRGRTYCLPYVYDHLQVELSYIELSPLVKFNLFRWLRFKPYLFAGPFVGWKIGAKKTRVMWQKENESIDLDNAKPFNFGLVAGAGTEYRAGFGDFCIDCRVNWGLANLMATIPGASQVMEDYQEGSNKDISLVFMLGFRF